MVVGVYNSGGTGDRWEKVVSITDRHEVPEPVFPILLLVNSGRQIIQTLVRLDHPWAQTRLWDGWCVRETLCFQ